MDMKVCVSCYIPSIKQTVMSFIDIDSKRAILEARDQILQSLGLVEERVLSSLGLERRILVFWNTSKKTPSQQ